MDEPLIFVRWRGHVSHAERELVRGQQKMKRVESAAADEWAKAGIELCELPPGLAKKTVEWLVEKGWAEAGVDGDAEGIPLDPESEGHALSLVTLSGGATWYQQRVGLPSAWMESTGSGKKLGVCDSGANHSHEWLKDSIVVSKNFVANETTVHDNEGHGTATAGITKAIAKDAKLVIARVMSMNSAKWSALGAGIIWCADQGCVATNVSIGGTSDSFSLSSAVSYSNSKNCPVIVSAGNAGTQVNSYPAATAGAIAVSATDQSDKKASFSQYGTHIKIAAPGVGLLTSYGSGYSSFSGTSGAAPIVTGCVGLVASKYGMSGTDALQAIFITARDLLNPLYFGVGIPDLIKALEFDVGEPPPPPPPPPPVAQMKAPTILNVTKDSVKFSWEPLPRKTQLVKAWAPAFTPYPSEPMEPGASEWTWRGLPQNQERKIAIQEYGKPETRSEFTPFKTLSSGEQPPPPPPPETPNLSTSTLSALAAIENDIPGYTRQIDKDDLKARLNRLAGQL